MILTIVAACGIIGLLWDSAFILMGRELHPNKPLSALMVLASVSTQRWPSSSSPGDDKRPGQKPRWEEPGRLLDQSSTWTSLFQRATYCWSRARLGSLAEFAHSGQCVTWPSALEQLLLFGANVPVCCGGAVSHCLTPTHGEASFCLFFFDYAEFQPLKKDIH